MDPISPSQNSLEPIYHASRKCLALFDDYITDTYLSEESLALVGELRGQFKTWAAYIGAFAVPRASLDARLASHDDIRNMVIDLLTMIERNLEWAKKNQLEKGEEEDKEELEASLGTSAVKSSIERLFILAVAIRRSARQTHDVRQKTYGGGNGDSSCLLLLKARYPNARKSLLDQLAQSVHARGVYLQYLQSHNRKLAHQREPSNKAREDPLEEKSQQLGEDLIPAKPVMRNPETDLETTPSMLSPTTVIRQHMRSIKPSRSLLSTGSTVKDMEGDELPYPPMPKRDSRTGRATCTICSEPMDISALTEEKWKPHVDGDLHPYVCISEQCKEPIKFFKRKQDWVEHMQTRHTMKWVQRIHTETWRCDIEHSESKYFDQKDHFMSHLKDDHHKQFTSSQIQGRARRSKKTATREPFVCPLCDCIPDDIEPIIHEKPYSKLTRHIRHHLKYISFLSLPYLGVDFGDGESIAGSSSDGNEKRASRTSHSLNNLRDVSLSDIPETEILDNQSCKVHDQVFFDDPPLDDEHLDWNFMPPATLETNWDMLRKGLGRSQSPARNISEGKGPQFSWAKFGGPVYFGTIEHFDPLRECLRSLAFPQMDSRFYDIDTAAQGTCDWLLRHETYTSWASCDRGLLWIKGKPGSGKSTLLRHVLNDAMAMPNTGEGALILSFFFHCRGSELQKTPLGLFRSLLHQLLRQIPEALTDLVATFQQRCESVGKPGEEWQWHPRELQRFLESSLLKVLTTHPVWLFVDALDECGKENAAKLAQDFKSLLQGLPSTGSQFRICFTCRHYPILDQTCQFEICLENENGKDIRTFVHDKLSSFPSTIPDLIIKHAQGVFIWAYLMVNQVLDLDQEGVGLKKIEAEIWSVPQELDTLYRQLIQSMSPDSLKLIQWICFAVRPLSLDELRWAMLVDADCPHQSLYECHRAGDYSSDHDGLKRRVQTLSRGLAEVTSDTKVVQFIHQSVKDFFVEKGLLALDDSVTSTDAATGMAHYRLSRICIRYLAMKEIDQSTSHERNKITIEFPFLHYTTTSWVAHMKQSDARGIPQEDLLEYFAWPSNTLVERWVRVYRILEKYSDDCPAEGTSLVHVMSRYGVAGALSATLERADQVGINIDAKDERGRTPLLWAARNGHKTVVKLLLDTDKVDVDARDYDGQIPLLWAAATGHKAVVELLLDTGKVDVDARDIYGRTPLSWAAENGHADVVELLLSMGKADVDARDEDGRTPLSWAARNGHKTVVELLLSMGKVDVDARDINGRTPLSWAAENGHEAVVQLLLDRGANTEAADKEGRTPLSWAAVEGHEAVVWLLLDRGANTEAADKKGRTPLSWAAVEGHEAVVWLLLDRGANTEAAYKDDGTPLSIAAANGYEAVVQLLLDRGANTEAADKEGRTPLSWAAVEGHEAVVWLLLDRGANTEAVAADGWTPLCLAAVEGHEAVVRLLLDRGANTEAADKEGRTPLSWAAANGHEAVVRLLRVHIAQPSSS